MTPIDAVLFDYGMVLCTAPAAAAWQHMEQLLGCDAATLKTAYWAERDAYDRGTLTGEQYWQRLASSLSINTDARLIADLQDADLDLWCNQNPPMVAWIDRLHTAGIRTGLLSNLGDAIELGLRARLPWLESVGDKVFSNRLGIAKPDAAVYAHAVHVLAVPAERILFIDDRPENIAGARLAGLTALPYTNHAEFLAELAALGETGLPTLA